MIHSSIAEAKVTVGRFSRVAVILLLVSFLVSATHGQQVPAASEESGKQPPRADSMEAYQTARPSFDAPPTWHGMVTNVPGDWVKYYHTTFRNENIAEYAGIAVMTGILLATDDATWQDSKRITKNSATIKSASDFFSEFGDGAAQMSLAAAFAAYGLAASDNRALRTASQTVQALLAGGMVVQVIKHVTGRESPFVATSPTGIWRFFPNQIDYHKKVPHYDAFPSGHICTSMSTVVVIAENYPEYTWIRPVGYTIVGLVGISMVNVGIHWYSDYPLGLAIGYTFGMIAAHPGGYDVAHFGKNDSHAVNISPTILPGGAGVTASLNLN